jgi:hypothetical protein
MMRPSLPFAKYPVYAVPSGAASIFQVPVRQMPPAASRRLRIEAKIAAREAIGPTAALAASRIQAMRAYSIGAGFSSLLELSANANLGGATRKGSAIDSLLVALQCSHRHPRSCRGYREGNHVCRTFQELSKPRLGNAEVRCLERPPNLFAVGVRSGIVAARTLMPHQIRPPSFLPRLRCFALFHSPNVEQAIRIFGRGCAFRGKCRHSSVGRAADL